MLGSDHQGERDAAGLAADRIVRSAGVRWEDLLRPVQPAALEFSREHQATGEAGIWANLRFCSRYFDHLTAWERSFVVSVSGRLKISAKQAGILQQAADRLRARGFA